MAGGGGEVATAGGRGGDARLAKKGGDAWFLVRERIRDRGERGRGERVVFFF